LLNRVDPYVKNSSKYKTVGMSKVHMVGTGLACHLLGIKKKQKLVL